VTSQSEKRKQDLLAKMVLEEQRGRELSKIVKEMLPDPKKKELLPDPKKNAVEKPARARKVPFLLLHSIRVAFICHVSK
jgi:hypothetical protein